MIRCPNCRRHNRYDEGFDTVKLNVIGSYDYDEWDKEADGWIPKKHKIYFYYCRDCDNIFGSEY